MKLFRSMYDHMMRWGHSPHGGLALFVIALVESSIFPIPPDILLLALCLSLPTRAFYFALLATVGSVIGGVVGYYIGFGLWEVAQPFFFSYVPGVSESGFEQVRELFDQYGFWVIFTAGFTPIPYKIFTISAGVFHVNLLIFCVASVVSRGLRFFIVAWLLYKFGAPVKHWIEKYFNLLSVLVTVVLILLVVVYRWLHG